MTQRTITRNGLLCALALMSLAGCSSVNNLLESDRIDYKSSVEKSAAPKLEVPPDLTQLQRDNRYALPSSSGSITASGYQQQQAVKPVADHVAPKSMGADVRIEREGNQRWLVVKKSPDVLWPQVKEFWQDSGFLINIEQPDAGVMETEWAENRAKLPQDVLRKTLGKVIDSLYSTGEMDKFRTRMERASDGTTEIFISHRGVREILVGANKEMTKWEPRPSEPELEAEFLSRLMVRLGVDSQRAKTMAAQAAIHANLAKVVKGADGSYIEVNEGFDRVWRRVGLALDRAGFTVEDRDRSQGVYFVRFVDQTKSPQDKGMLSKLFTFGSSDKANAAQRYRISVKSGGQTSQVLVLGNDGRSEQTAIGEKILKLLLEQLK